MKKNITSLIVAAALYCNMGASAQTLLYSNDFESGLNGSAIVGNGVIEDSGNPAHGMVFHNAAGGQVTRTNYLTLPTTIFSDLLTSGTNALSISFWVNKGTATGYYWSPIFSAYGAAPAPNNDRPMMVLQARGVAQVNAPSGTWCDFTNAQNVKGTNAMGTTWIDDANWHFYTATFTPASVKVYIDGVVMNEWTLTGDANGSSVNGLLSIGSALNYICLGGNQAWSWNDPDPAFLFDKLKIYAGALTGAQITSLKNTDGLVSPTLASSKTNLYLENSAIAESFVANGANLSQDITITAPAGIIVSPTTISKTAATDVTVKVTYNGTSSVNGNITLTSGSKVLDIPVIAAPYDYCYTPAYPSGNMIADPTFSQATLATGGFGGWGPTGISTTAAYCGRGSAYIRGTCWPDGGSLDRTLSATNGNALKPLTKYRLRAMVNSKASTGKTFQFQVEGVNGTGSVFFQIPNTNGWKQIDTTFTTGATVTTGKGIYFNSCNDATPAITDTCFIDNYEMYAVPKVYVLPSSLTFLATGTQKKVAVRAENLSQDITITAPAGFSVSPASMLSTVSGGTTDSLTVTFNGPGSATGYIFFVSGGVKDSIQVTGTVAPTIVANPTSLTLDDIYHATGSFVVSGANLLSDITITAPAGITVVPATISKSAATSVTVNVTYDKTTPSVSGNIVLTGGTAVANVPVTAGILPQTDPGAANLTHMWTFDDATAADAVGDADGTLQGAAAFTNKAFDTSAGGYLDLPGATIAVNGYTALTTEAWFTSANGLNPGNTMLSYFGDAGLSGWMGANYIFSSPSSGANCRTAITTGNTNNPWATETGVNSQAGRIDDGKLHHLVSTLDGTTIRLYVDGQNVGSSALANGNSLSTVSNASAYLCKSGYNDPTWKGLIHKYSLFNKALAADEVLYLFVKGAEYQGVPTDINGLNEQSRKVYLDGSKLVVEFALAKESDVNISIYDMQGRLLVKSDKWSDAGFNKSVIDASPLQGIYIVKIVTDEFSVSKKIVK